MVFQLLLCLIFHRPYTLNVMNIFRVLAQDAKRYDRQLSIRFLLRLLVQSPGFSAVILIRVMQAVQVIRVPFVSMLVTFRIRRILISNFGIDVGPNCKIGPGLKIDHPVGIVIGGGVVIGECATILSGCVIGEKYIDKRSTGAYPILGNHVTVGCGSIILGGIILGDKVNIGAGSIVIKSVPGNSQDRKSVV